MPTKLPRYQITETPEIAAALDHAARKWPGLKRSELLRKLILAGDPYDDAAEGAAAAQARLERLKGVVSGAGRFTHVFPPGYLEELRKDWPE